MPDDKRPDFSPEFMDKYRFLQRERAARIQKLEEQARKKAREIAAVLKEKYGVSRFTFTARWHGAASRRVLISTSLLPVIRAMIFGRCM